MMVGRAGGLCDCSNESRDWLTHTAAATEDLGIWGTWGLYDLWTLTFETGGKEQENL